MEQPIYAAHCECGAFGVSTHGTDWDQRGITELARVHLQNCRSDEPPSEIQIVKRHNGDDEVVDTVTLEVPAP